jgi:hypothetical protein
MDGHSLLRHWPVIKSRLAKAGLSVVSRPLPEATAPARPAQNPDD